MQVEKLRRLTRGASPLVCRPFSELYPAMANTKSAAKRARQTTRRTATNQRSLTAVKNQLKTVRSVIKGGKKAEAKDASAKFSSTVDKAVKAGRVHPNKANRLKSRLAKAQAKLA